MGRLNLKRQSFQKAASLLAGKNPTFLKVALSLPDAITEVDPGYDDQAGSIAVLLDFDTLGLYEEKLWKFFSWLCQKKPIYCAAVLRGWKFGLITPEQIHAGMENKGKGWEMDKLVANIQSREPDFNTHARTAKAQERIIDAMGGSELAQAAQRSSRMTAARPKHQLQMDENESWSRGGERE